MIYLKPNTPHQLFINAYYQACDITLTKEQCQQRGAEVWGEIKSDSKLQRQFIVCGPKDRMQVVKKEPVRPHRTVNFFVASEFRFPVDPAVDRGEVKESSVVPPVTHLSEHLLQFLQFICVDPLVLVGSEMLLKDDFAQPLNKFAKLIHDELTLGEECQCSSPLCAEVGVVA